MTQQHDWLANVGENYVAYLFSRDNNFEVFGSGMWDADCAVHDLESNMWYRVEVKTSDVKLSLKEVRGPAKKRLKKQASKFDLICFVSIIDGKIRIEFYKKNKECIVNPTVEELKKFIYNF